MPVTLRIDGLERAIEMTEQLAAFGSLVTGAVLVSKSREDGGVSNAVVAEALRDNGRDFFTSTREDVSMAAEAFVLEAERRLQQIAASGPGKQLRVARPTGETGSSRAASNAAAGAWRAAMRVFRDIVASRMDRQVTSDGGAPRPVEEGYARARFERYGIATDIAGKATGQLLANLADDSAIEITADAPSAASRSKTNARLAARVRRSRSR